MAPVEGFWGEVTSTIDWCEENYVVTSYIAEFWNTVSNFIMILAPSWMVYIAWKEKHETHLLCSFLAVTVVGIGSWLFHMTLRYSMQLMDELPMTCGSACIVYTSYVANYKPNEVCKPLAVFLVIYTIVVTLVYIVVKDPVFHESAYALMVFASVVVNMRVLILNSYTAQYQSGWFLSPASIVWIVWLILLIASPNSDVIDYLVVNTALSWKLECHKGLFLVAFITWSLGFFLWNVDNLYCHHLKSIRSHSLLGFLGPVFQFHAWWHIFVGIGTYMILIFQVHTRYLFLRRDPQLKFLIKVWPYVSMNEVRPTQTAN